MSRHNIIKNNISIKTACGSVKHTYHSIKQQVHIYTEFYHWKPKTHHH